MKDLFTLRAPINKKMATFIAVFGFFFFIAVWYVLCEFELVNKSILPNPVDVLKSFGPLISETDIRGHNLFGNIGYSLKLNFMGYIEAILLSIPIGFLIGLFPFFRELLGRYSVAIRFLPLTALTGLMIAWFGLTDGMKIHFLALGIFVYLLPTVVDRVGQTMKVYVQTAKTLGATKWQVIKTVFIPDVLSRVSTDIINITAISWTYIVIAETLVNTGGIGAMVYQSGRNLHIDQAFALLAVIIFIGILQDIVFKQLDAIIFPHKYNTPNLLDRAKKFFTK